MSLVFAPESCKALNIEVAWEQLENVDALIIKGRNGAYIVLRQGQMYESREKFGISHELGHFCIPSHLADCYTCKSSDMLQFNSYRKEEREANCFAAELLMPTQWLIGKLRKTAATLDFIRTVSSECGTSLSSTACRVTDICPDKIAVVYSEDGFIKWFKKSKTFPYYVNKGELNPSSYAADFFNHNYLLDKPNLILANAWVCDADSDDYLNEESVPMPNLNAVLTILTVPFDDNEENLDEEMYWFE
ncbi:MAG TPA: ImmA/IrrE family metallo-endopeptidase [Firmicutes bacterium]|nr:ImmA/IrrE family metallo-endopeptidase [Bacillota bacterium]